MSTNRLLVLSNGHGEDLIARRILEPLQRLEPSLAIAVLPLVGQGSSYRQMESISAIGPRLTLPSGGFSNQSAGGLAQDLKAGLLGNTWKQWQSLQQWSHQGGRILAVGDLLPLAMAWASGLPYGFIGTPKSDYTWSSGPGSAWPADAYHRCKRSEWDPWEWALMQGSHCRLVICRDRLTARGLHRHGVRALAPGNPMMDGFLPSSIPASLTGLRRLLLLPGSRAPEARRNLRRLLKALPPSSEHVLLLACGQQPDDASLRALMEPLGYQTTEVPTSSDADAAWRGPGGLLLLGRGRFETWAPWAELGLACAGTATEQLVGLGCPALSLPGQGPQFKRGFAERQSRLLGGAVRVCQSPDALATGMQLLLNEPELRAELGRIGRRRMGPAGGSLASAQAIQRHLLP